MIRQFSPVFLLFLFLCSCVPKDQVVLRKIDDIIVDTGTDGIPTLRGKAVFYNPNRVRMKLKEINVEVFVDGKKSAHADQKLNSVIPARAEFSVGLEIKLSLEKQNLLNTFMSLLGGKKYEIYYKGYIKVKVHGVTFKVPVEYKDELRLKI